MLFFSVNIIFLCDFFHINEHFEEKKISQIHVDGRISAPKLITHKQICPKMP